MGKRELEAYQEFQEIISSIKTNAGCVVGVFGLMMQYKENQKNPEHSTEICGRIDAMEKDLLVLRRMLCRYCLWKDICRVPDNVPD